MEKVKGAFYFVSILLFSSQLNAGSTSPSQTVPKVLEEIEKDKIKNLGNQNFLNGLGNTGAKQADLEQISVLVSSIVIIASKELQNVIKFDKYKKELIGKLKSITDLNLIAREMSKDFQSQGLPLVRVILPKQELKPKGATVFFKVIDGFVEKIDLQKVPRMQRKAIFRYLREKKDKF